jgi:peptidoglycan/xylan/chitin deacetylase (PgdA/CDA1 family)
MTNLFWAWVAMLLCSFGPIPSAAGEVPALPSTAPVACAIEAAGPYPGLRRTDSFEPGEIVLTFDDGPQPVPTKKLLDLLDKHQLKATFFVVGLWVRDDTYQLIQRMVKSGHEIGTHTYGHDLHLVRRGWGAEYVEGQYELVNVLVEVALLAKSPEEFRQLYRRVFERKPGVPLKHSQVRAEWRSIQRNHFQLLAEHGHSEDRRLYPMLFARPPGGIPYEGRWPSKAMRQEHETALRRLGMMNILWHGGAGDTVLGRLDDFQFLVDNVRYHTRKGGVLLIHDRMRHDAMVAAFERLTEDPKIRVVTLRSAVEAKYACDGAQLYASLRPSRALAARENLSSGQ